MARRIALSDPAEVRIPPLGRKGNTHDEARLRQITESLGGGADPIKNAVVHVEEAGGLHGGAQGDAETGVSINTLLSRKRYAVLHLRVRLQNIHDELANEVRSKS